MTARAPHETFHIVQYLRAVAAAAVVFNHAGFEVATSAARPSFLAAHPGAVVLGACGVDVFFVISGFIIFRTMTPRSGLAPAAAFVRARFLRVVPLYWLWTSVLALAILAHLVLRNVHIDLATAVTSYLLIPHEAVPGKYYPILLPGWTLSFEMYFYAAVALLVAAVPHGRRLPALAALLALVQLTVRAAPVPAAIGQWLGSGLVYEFLAGAALAAAFGSGGLRRRVGAHPRLGLALIALGAAALAGTALVPDAIAWRVPLWGGPAVVLMVGALLAERPPGGRATRALFWLGTASYSLYLTHFLGTSALGGAMKRGYLLGVQPDLLALTATALIVAAGSSTYPVIERPLMAALRGGARRGAPEALPAT